MRRHIGRAGAARRQNVPFSANADAAAAAATHAHRHRRWIATIVQISAAKKYEKFEMMMIRW